MFPHLNQSNQTIAIAQWFRIAHRARCQSAGESLFLKMTKSKVTSLKIKNRPWFKNQTQININKFKFKVILKMSNSSKQLVPNQSKIDCLKCCATFRKSVAKPIDTYTHAEQRLQPLNCASKDALWPKSKPLLFWDYHRLNYLTMSKFRSNSLNLLRVLIKFCWIQWSRMPSVTNNSR